MYEQFKGHKTDKLRNVSFTKISRSHHNSLLLPTESEPFGHARLFGVTGFLTVRSVCASNAEKVYNYPTELT